MIKRYNQFVENKINEDYEIESELEAPVRELPLDEEPPINTPTDIDMESEFEGEGEEEEVAVCKYTDALQKLADAAEKVGLNYNIVSSDEKKISAVEISDRKVTFPSENEKYVVEGVKKPFDTLQEVLAYFESGVSPQSRKEVRDEMSSIKDEEFLDKEEQFESKSYKFKSYKN